MSCGVGCRRGLDPALLWLWCRLVLTAPIQPLALEPPYAVGAAPQKMATLAGNQNPDPMKYPTEDTCYITWAQFYNQFCINWLLKCARK